MQSRMRWDTREWVRTVKQLQAALNISFDQAELILSPYRARLRVLKNLERSELLATAAKRGPQPSR